MQSLQSNGSRALLMEGSIRYLGHQSPNGTSHKLSKYVYLDVYIAVSGGRPRTVSVNVQMNATNSS